MIGTAASPTEISEAFWALSNRFKRLVSEGALAPNTPGVTHWYVALLPAHEIVTFEHDRAGSVSISWVTVDPRTREDELNEVVVGRRSFDLMFAGALHD